MNQIATIKRTLPSALPSAALAPSPETAPLRFEGSGQYDVSPDDLFKFVSEAESLHRWLPMIRKIGMDHSRSETCGEMGAGSVRSCSFRGMGDVEEGIFWWNPPHGYGFRFTPKGRARMSMPTSNHLIYFLVTPDEAGGSRLTIRTHFQWRGLIMRHLAVHMMPMMLNRALANLRRELGGTGGTMRRVG